MARYALRETSVRPVNVFRVSRWYVATTIRAPMTIAMHPKVASTPTAPRLVMTAMLALPEMCAAQGNVSPGWPSCVLPRVLHVLQQVAILRKGAPRRLQPSHVMMETHALPAIRVPRAPAKRAPRWSVTTKTHALQIVV